MPIHLTDMEYKAVRFYIGDTAGMEQDGFWNDPKAYVVLNSLFYPGIATEQARAAEGKRLNPEIIADSRRLELFYQALFSAFRKCRAERPLISYRVERFADYQVMEQNQKTISFTSTSANGFLKAYQDRIGIALLKFRIPAKTPCLIMHEILPDYAKQEEAEILLPPGLTLQIAKKQITEQEMQICDAAGQPPQISCCVSVQLPEIRKKDDFSELHENGNIAGIRIFQKLQSGVFPDEQDISCYSAWKQSLTARMISYLT